MNSLIHGYETKTQTELHLATVNTKFVKRSWKSKASSIWNSLPRELKEYLSIGQFTPLLEPFYGSPDFVLDNMGEPVPEETF